MVSTLPHEICIALEISSTFILLSSLISFSTAAITVGAAARKEQEPKIGLGRGTCKRLQVSTLM